MTAPPGLPTYATNQEIDTLRTAELLAVATLRLWVAAHIDPEGGVPDWRDGLAAASLEAEPSLAFDDLLRLVAQEARRVLDVRCPRCQRLGSDEGRFLELVSLLQRGRPDQAMAILLDWLPPAVARFALLPAMVFAQALGDHGLVVPWRHGQRALPRPIHTPGLCGHADRGFALVQ